MLQEEITTAPKLAEKFEVSRRTIERDIEALCEAGIPIQTTQGSGGGVRIMEGYSMDKTLLTSKDMQVIMAGLCSLDSISGSNYYGLLMEKIKTGASDFICGRDYILIDLSSWSKETISPKISLNQDAIEGRRHLSFQYFSPSGDSIRIIEPYYLLFKWSSWYVWGWCINRQDYRLFKLSRMEQIQVKETSFELRDVKLPELSIHKIYPSEIHVRAILYA